MQTSPWGRRAKKALADGRILLVAAIAWNAGCGETGKPRMHGEVTINGQPAEQGEIHLAPKNGVGPTAGAIIAAGRYDITTTQGAKRVEIQAYRQAGKQSIDPSMPGAASATVLEPLLPARYNSESELEVEIVGDMEKDFNLTAP